MAKRHRVKITVLKKLSAKEVYGGPLPEVGEEMTSYSDRLQEGHEFVTDEAGASPSLSSLGWRSSERAKVSNGGAPSP